MKKRIAFGLTALLLLVGVVGAAAQDVVDLPATAGPTVQCSDLAVPWTTIWWNGEIEGRDAFAVMVVGNELIVRGLRCGKGLWQIEQVCISGPEQVLWYWWELPATARIEWGLPYAPEQVAVLGACWYETDGARPPIAWPFERQRGGLRPPVVLPTEPSQYR